MKARKDDVGVHTYRPNTGSENITGEEISWAIERNMHQNEVPWLTPQGNAPSAKAAASGTGPPMRAHLSS